MSAEYRNALAKAQQYSDMMHMSKQGIYDQLTSEYGEKFPADAAQYAIDNVEADWNANALERQSCIRIKEAMSKSAIHDQLTSQYGEQFTESRSRLRYCQSVMRGSFRVSLRSANFFGCR